MKISKLTYAKYLWFLIGLTLFLSSCMKDELLWEQTEWTVPAPIDGVFILNEGNFMYNNASLSFYEPHDRQIHNDVFFSTNGFPLGDVAQSMTLHHDLAYIVMNNSGKIYIINPKTMGYKGKITGFTGPRHIHFVSDNKAYVSDLYAQSIYIIDPNKKEITGTIELVAQDQGFYRHSTDMMVQIGSRVFVNAWSYDNSILVINTETDTWEHTIEVVKQPQSMVADRENNLWVMSDGGYPGSPYGSEAGALTMIDTESLEVERVFRFSENDSPRSLSINGRKDTLYFLNRHAYRQAAFDELKPERIIESPYGENHSGGFYSISVNPFNSEIYVADAIDFVQAGLVYRFSPAINPVDTFRVGIIPGAFTFRQASDPKKPVESSQKSGW